MMIVMTLICVSFAAALRLRARTFEAMDVAMFLFVLVLFGFAPLLIFIIAMICRHNGWSTRITVYMIGSSICVPLLAALVDMNWLIGILIASWTPQVLAIAFFEWLESGKERPKRRQP